mmetsp:Transcript_15210/g.31011  ORF Transcript_15210/g.31011 Transcript_15210/m.31011 type:complete len:423 (-) Transcript_15210:163-1431(-)
MADSSPRSDNLTQEQSTVSNNHENQNSEAELERLVSPPPQNCCTWYVAAAFLVLLAISLIVTWTMLPAEDIVMKYLPHFDEPENPYLGPEAGDPLDGREDDLDGGEASADDDLVDIGDLPEEVADGNYEIGTTVPTFMRCADGEECCNGSSSNCDLRLNEMMFGMVHNSMSTEEGGFILGYNHYLALEKALVAGYRGLSLDVCNCNGILQFCHNVCDLGERMPNEVFSNTVQFLTDFPSEVIVLFIEASIDRGPISWTELYNEMAAVDGFVDMMYVHDGGQWPTMREMVQKNSRIVVFYFNPGTCDNDVCPAGFHYLYDYAAETVFDSASLNDLQNYEYSCTVTRGPGINATADFFVVNNFVTPPDPSAAEISNSKDFLANRLTKCANIQKMRPNFVYLDFWSIGVTAELVQYANAQYAESG